MTALELIKYIDKLWEKQNMESMFFLPNGKEFITDNGYNSQWWEEIRQFLIKEVIK